MTKAQTSECALAFALNNFRRDEAVILIERLPWPRCRTGGKFGSRRCSGSELREVGDESRFAESFDLVADDGEPDEVCGHLSSDHGLVIGSADVVSPQMESLAGLVCSSAGANEQENEGANHDQFHGFESYATAIDPSRWN